MGASSNNFGALLYRDIVSVVLLLTIFVLKHNVDIYNNLTISKYVIVVEMIFL